MPSDPVTLDRVRVLRESERFPNNGEWELATLDDLIQVLEGMGATREMWCKAHDNKYEIFPGIDQGCGWANPMKPCERDERDHLVLPLPAPQGEEGK